MTAARFRTIKLLIGAGIVATAFHFADNTFAIERYPEPAWITPFGVAVSWFVVTALAVFALARKTAGSWFTAASAAYALVLLSGLLHYAFGDPMRMAMRSNLTVVTEALVGVVLAGTLLVTRLARR